jgi:hypothetical protein
MTNRANNKLRTLDLLFKTMAYIGGSPVILQEDSVKNRLLILIGALSFWIGLISFIVLW